MFPWTCVYQPRYKSPHRISNCYWISLRSYFHRTSETLLSHVFCHSWISLQTRRRQATLISLSHSSYQHRTLLYIGYHLHEHRCLVRMPVLHAKCPHNNRRLHGLIYRAHRLNLRANNPHSANHLARVIHRGPFWLLEGRTWPIHLHIESLHQLWLALILLEVNLQKDYH